MRYMCECEHLGMLFVGVFKCECECLCCMCVNVYV